MSDHIRKTIRDEVATSVTGLTTTGANVFKSRAMPLQDNNLPGLVVYTSFEAISDEEGRIGTPRLQVRALNVDVKAYDKILAGADDQLDTIAAEVETALLDGSLTTMDGLDLVEIETEVHEGAEQLIGEMTMRFVATYLTYDGAPTVKV